MSPGRESSETTVHWPCCSCGGLLAPTPPRGTRCQKEGRDRVMLPNPWWPTAWGWCTMALRTYLHAQRVDLAELVSLTGTVLLVLLLGRRSFAMAPTHDSGIKIQNPVFCDEEFSIYCHIGQGPGLSGAPELRASISPAILMAS